MTDFLSNYWPILLFALIFGYIKIRAMKIKKIVPKLLDQGAVVVDVRSEGEFMASHNPKSINIPLDQLQKRFQELDKSKMILLCCASGSRSAVAQRILKSKGFLAMNGGTWMNTVSS